MLSKIIFSDRYNPVSSSIKFFTLVRDCSRGTDCSGVLSPDELFKNIELDLLVEIEFDDCLSESLVVFDLIKMLLKCLSDNFGSVLLADFRCYVF
jgi:hypothetical protein